MSMILNALHITLTLVVLGLHGVSLVVLMSCASSYQEKSAFTYKTERWLSVFNMGREELGIYLIRLILGACMVLFAMNFWHLFTFHNEAAPIVKNVSWRTGNLLVAFIFCISSFAFKRESKRP